MTVADTDFNPTYKPLDIPLTPKTAKRCFTLAKEIADKDNGKLWNHRLDAPILIVDYRARKIVANQGDSEGRLTPAGKAYTGKLPATENLGATVTTWSGTRWVMVPWPAPKDDTELRHILAHEMFHYIDLAPQAVSCNHLDELNARMLIFMEWRALAAALDTESTNRKEAITDALVFRNKRYSLYPNARIAECAAEMNEGLAEYTGVRLAGGNPNEIVDLAGRNLTWSYDWSSLVNSFAYVSGPLYGLILDRLEPDWRESLAPDSDLGAILAKAVDIQLPSPIDASKIAEKYGWDKLYAREKGLDHQRQARYLSYTEKFIAGPTIRIPVCEANFQFDPREVRVFPGHGQVYRQMRITDEWGILEVNRNGVLVSEDWTSLTISAPADIGKQKRISGNGWILQLSPGWKIVWLSSAENYKIERIEE